MSKNYGDLAPEQVAQEAERALARDRIRLNNVNSATYPGRTISPMSSLTQRGRTLQKQFNSQPAPYSANIVNTLTRPNTSLSPQGIQELLNIISQGQSNLQTKGQNIVANQFGSSLTPYNNRIAGVQKRNARDLQSGLAEAGSKVQNINREFGAIEGERNRAVGRNFQNLQGSEQAKRQLLLNNLEKFGNQQHGYNNLSSDIERRRFEEEANAPEARAQKLASTLDRSRGLINENVLPELQKAGGSNIARALNTYNNPLPPYKGDVIAPLPSEIRTSHNVLERIDPEINDTYSGARNNLVGELSNPRSIGERALADVPNSIRPQVKQFDRDAKARIKKDIQDINNQYLRIGQFGTEQHRKDLEARTREINRSALEQRNKILQGSLVDQFKLQQGEDIGKNKQLDALRRSGETEYADLLNKITQMNKLGSTKWQNNQAEEEELYKNYNRAGANEWPSNSSGRLPSDIFSNLPNRDIGLDNLNNLRTNYSELNKDPVSNLPPITTIPQGNQALQTLLPTSAKPARPSPIAPVNPQIAKDQALQDQYKGLTIYDVQRMKQDIQNSPGYNTSTLSNHPASVFLRQNNNQLTLPSGGLSNRYGAAPSDVVSNFFGPKPNKLYPGFGSYQPPTVDFQTLRQQENFKKGGKVKVKR